MTLPKHHNDDLFALLDNLPGMVYRCTPDEEWTMVYLNSGAERLLERSTNQTWTRRAFAKWIAPDHRSRVMQKLEKDLANKRTFDASYPLQRASGDYVWVWERVEGNYADDGSLLGLVGFVTDISEQKQAEEMVAYLAYYDVLTGLPNRLLFLERLTTAIIEAPDTSEQMAVAYLNLNRFTLILKSFGHLNGDQLIKAMSTRLEKAIG